MARKQYENEFKVMIVELLQSGVSPKKVSEDYNLNVSMISRWKREYVSRSGDFTKKRELNQQQQDLKKLQKELKETKLERDILKKALSIFSKSDQ